MKRMKKKIMSNLNNVKDFSGEGYTILKKNFWRKLIIERRLKNLITPVYAPGHVTLLKIQCTLFEKTTQISEIPYNPV